VARAHLFASREMGLKRMVQFLMIMQAGIRRVMTMNKTDDIVISRLEELKESFDPNSDEYADISQTIHYLERER